MLEKFLFVSGAPRTGTTFVSDWLTQLPDAYCVHEVLSDLRGRSAEDALTALEMYASSGADRLDKVRQREFLAWPDRGLETSTPSLIGWKEPVTWERGGLAAMPDPLRTLLPTHCDKVVVTVRHPFDVVASGRRREATTTNWRPLSVVEHCSYWLSTLDMIRDLREAECDLLVLRWEDLLARPDRDADRLGRFLGLELPAFEGYERDTQELESMRAHVDSRRGLVGHATRRYLTEADEEEITRLLHSEAAGLGYELRVA